ncbi:hypothetical protein [Mangrovimonas sp. YM274]|uniref:hypothetical protein n=1 Tax=Mangrovimonas sp. YM274 TaxID=3070660 RepID=UPI0027DB784C|nr:hypothetical protein [Mangrovimonas sp. YM274]WMI70066.1 hypothetical protein RBH95_06880 [Mangrovimonas sp. YM274]
MKKTFKTLAIALMVSTLGFSQEEGDKDKKFQFDLSGEFMFTQDFQNVGIELEIISNNEDSDKPIKTATAFLGYSMMDYSTPVGSATGNGYTFWLGSKTYFNKENAKGFYIGNNFNFGAVWFDENGVDGRFSYLSLFSPELGYKFKFGNLIVEPIIGTAWNIEIKGQGFIDNKYVDNWQHRGALRIGYSF